MFMGFEMFWQVGKAWQAFFNFLRWFLFFKIVWKNGFWLAKLCQEHFALFACVFLLLISGLCVEVYGPYQNFEYCLLVLLMLMGFEVLGCSCHLQQQKNESPRKSKIRSNDVQTLLPSIKSSSETYPKTTPFTFLLFLKKF